MDILEARALVAGVDVVANARAVGLIADGDRIEICTYYAARWGPAFDLGDDVHGPGTRKPFGKTTWGPSALCGESALELGERTRPLRGIQPFSLPFEDLLKDAGASPDLSLARQKRPEKGRLPKRARVETEGWEGVDRDLFERLRALRMQVARKRGVPPYVIFHDTTLREIARTKPKTIEELRHVKGVGDRKSADLGDLILTTIAAP